MAKRKTSDSVRKMRLIILGIALALVVIVVGLTWYTLSREAETGEIEWTTSSTTTTTARVAGQPRESTTGVTGTTAATTTNAQGLPYDTSGSDLYAEWDGKHPSAEVIVKKGSDGKWAAFVKDKFAPDATGVYVNEYGWWFVRNGYVDYQYSGIAGNENGKWYIDRGKADFSFNGTYTPTGASKHYTIVEGSVVRETNL